MKLPKLTKKQAEILDLLYRYRFLNRIQIQVMLGHKDYRRINAWLKDLTHKQYINRIYSTHFLEKTKPAVYFLGINGIRHLRKQTIQTAQGELRSAYPIMELRKRYREHQRTEAYRSLAMLAAECSIALQQKADNELQYDIKMRSDFMHSDHEYHFLADTDEIIKPNMCIVKRMLSAADTLSNKADRSGDTTHYLLEIFEPTTPRYTIRYRIKQYIDFFNYGSWELSDQSSDPIILLVVPRLTDLIYAKHRVKKHFEYDWLDTEPEQDEAEKLHLRFTTYDLLQQQGITAPIWEEGRERHAV